MPFTVKPWGMSTHWRRVAVIKRLRGTVHVTEILWERGSAGQIDWRLKCSFSNAVLSFSMKFHVIEDHKTCDQITSDRKSRLVWQDCAIYILFTLSGCPNKYWLQFWQAGVNLLLALFIHLNNNFTFSHKLAKQLLTHKDNYILGF